MVAERDDLLSALALVSPDDFRDFRLAEIWRSVERVVRAGDTPSLVMVAYDLQQRGKLEDVGEESYLASLVGSEGSFLYRSEVFLSEHARIVHDWGERKRTIDGLSKQVQQVVLGTRGNGVSVPGLRSEFEG